MQKPFNVSEVEASLIVAVIDIRRGRADHDQSFKVAWLFDRCQGPDHRTHRMADKGYAADFQLLNDLQHIFCIASQRTVVRPVECRKIGIPGADIVEKHQFEVAFESGNHCSPHTLITAISVSKHEGSRTVSADFYIVTVSWWNSWTLGDSSQHSVKAAGYLPRMMQVQAIRSSKRTHESITIRKF